MKHVTIILGSNGKNLSLADLFKKELGDQGHKVDVINLVEADLPLYTRAQKTPSHELIAPFLDALKAESFLFIAPEYNGGIPPALSNFIAWTSTTGKDWRAHFNSKKAALATYSGGDGQLFLAMMRLQLAYIGMNVIARQINANDRKEANPDSIKEICHQLTH